MLARLVAELDARPDADIVHCDFILIDDAGEEIGLSRVGPFDRLLPGNNFAARFLFRPRLPEVLGAYDPGLFGAGVYDSWFYRKSVVVGRVVYERVDLCGRR